MNAQHPITPSSIRTIRQGHFANCSATGSVVGMALLSVVAVGAIVNAFADRFARWSATPERPDKPPDGGEPSGPPGPRQASGGAPARTPRVRPEGDGAIVAWPSPPALIDVDADTARALLQRGARAVGGDLPVPGALSAPTEVHVALSARCAAGCTGCYQDARPDGPAADAAALEDDLDALAQMGVFEIAVGGGEPLRSPDLVPVVEGIVRRGLVANVTTSGLGLDAARARWLAAHTGQVNVSLDGLGEVYAAARGWDGAPVALRALRLLREAGARVGVNTVIVAANVDHLDAMADALAALGVTEWHWIRFKPVGRGTVDAAPSPAQLDGLWPRLLELEGRTGLSIRVDCALAPLVLGASPAPDPAALRRLGVTGCAGGHSLWARDTDGTFAPCSYAASQRDRPPERTAPAIAWRQDPTLLRWRDRPATGPCASCPVHDVCRGGCHVVAQARLGDAMAPDPDCPRVRAWAS